MVKVLFYHANYITQDSLSGNSLYLSLASLYLKTYIELNLPDTSNQIEWITPVQNRLTDQELIDLCNKYQPDLLCTGHYIWNHEFLKTQLLTVKKKLPTNCKIVVGGPSVDVNINSNFFKQNPYADFAVYGPGEAAFADLIAHIIDNKKIIAFNVSNLAWYDSIKQNQTIADYKYVSQSKISPFLFNKDYFAKMVKHELDKGLTLSLPYELTRGCPYSCTFCDWNSGLSNKVSRRKKSYREEIDLFQSLKIKNLFLSDANFGQYDEDIEIVEYLVEKNLNENAQFKIDGNLSKLKKENNLKIFHLAAKGNLLHLSDGFTFSVQDVNEEILKNINRPDVGWQVHKKMLEELGEHYPTITSKVQFIVGLPGQNLKTIQQSLTEITKVNSLKLTLFLSELLPASPASLDRSYQEKYKFKYSTSERTNIDAGFFRSKFPASCVSFDQAEFVDMVVLASFYAGLTVLREQICHNNLQIDLVADKFMQSSYFQSLRNNLYENWVKHDKFYYTVNFDGSSKIISACQMVSTGIRWLDSIECLKFLIEHLKHDKQFVKSLLNKKSGKG